MLTWQLSVNLFHGMWNSYVTLRTCTFWIHNKVLTYRTTTILKNRSGFNINPILLRRIDVQSIAIWVIRENQTVLRCALIWSTAMISHKIRLTKWHNISILFQQNICVKWKHLRETHPKWCDWIVFTSQLLDNKCSLPYIVCSGMIINCKQSNINTLRK